MRDLPAHLCTAALRRAAAGHIKTAERDLHRLFGSLGMAIPIPTSILRSGPHALECIKLSSWFKYMLINHSSYVLGGFGMADANMHLCLRAFWETARSDLGQHVVYELHAERLHRCLPFAVHADEGRSLRKSAILVTSAQAVIGHDTATLFYELFQENWTPRMSDELAMNLMQCAHRHNAKGCTFKTRMLHTALPKAMYVKNNSHVFETLMEELRQECTSLFEEGITVGDDDDVYYPVCIAFKGDSPMIAKAGYLTRSFQNLGNPCCFECMAGPTLPFEDCRRNPCWEHTIYTQRPWEQPSPISQIPGFPNTPERLFKKDPFHIYKQSVGGSYIASSLILLLDLGYFRGDTNSVDALLQRAWSDFHHFVKHDRKGKSVPFIKHFTKTNMHFPRQDSYPYARLKGSDTMLLTRWLLHLVTRGPIADGARQGSLIDGPLDPQHGPIMVHMARAATGALSFFQTLHSHGLWLPRLVALEVGESAWQFTSSYAFLAKESHRIGLNRFSLVPSLHYMHHFYIDAKRTLQDESVQWMLSPMLGNTEADEDYIGKISRLSRRVHAMKTTARTIDRLKIRMHFVLHDAEG